MNTNHTVRLRAPLFLACCIAALALCATGCDSFLETGAPDSQLSTPLVFEDRATAAAAMTEVYAKMRDAGLFSGSNTGLSYALGLYADELDFYGSAGTDGFVYHSNALLASSTPAAALWNASYRQAYGANAVIYGVEHATELPEADRRQLKGEALFVRGLLHFQMACLYGPVPYVATTDYRANSRLARLSEADALGKAREDLEQAAALLAPDYIAADRTRANAYAAHALLARLCLYQGDWPAAADHASAVINRDELYGFDASFAGTFLKGSRGTLFQFAPRHASTNTLEAVTFIFEGNPSDVALNVALVESFEPGDLRRASWIREVQGTGGTRYHAYKYRAGVGAPAQVEFSKMLRLAEVYLVRSEARARQGELTAAMADLNAVRHQAGLPDSQASGQAGLLEALLRERRAELFAEHGHRFFDLKRFGRLDEVLGQAKEGWEARCRLFPVPLQELLLNPALLPQNPGY